MAVHKAVRRLHNELKDLRQARREHKADVKDLRKHQHELKKDRKELKRDIKTGQKLHKSLDKERNILERVRNNKSAALGNIESKRQEILERYGADSFDPLNPTTIPDPMMQAELAALDAKKVEVTAKIDAKITEGRGDVTTLRERILGKRAEIKKDRKEIKQDVRAIKVDRRELKRDRREIKQERKEALKVLLPAEYKMGLKATNRARIELGLKPVDHVIRPLSGSKRLAAAARSAAMSMGGYNSQGLCATGVSKAIQNAYGVKVWGNGNQIDNNLPRSLFKQVHMPLEKALKIPGLVLTWERTSTSLGRIYGHTAITLGDGHSSASDFIESNTIAGNASRSGLKIFMPRKA